MKITQKIVNALREAVDNAESQNSFDIYTHDISQLRKAVEKLPEWE